MNHQIFCQDKAQRSLIALVIKASTQRSIDKKDGFKILSNLGYSVLYIHIESFNSFRFSKSNNDYPLRLLDSGAISSLETKKSVFYAEREIFYSKYPIIFDIDIDLYQFFSLKYRNQST